MNARRRFSKIPEPRPDPYWFHVSGERLKPVFCKDPNDFDAKLGLGSTLTPSLTLHRYNSRSHLRNYLSGSSVQGPRMCVASPCTRGFHAKCVGLSESWSLVFTVQSTASSYVSDSSQITRELLCCARELEGLSKTTPQQPLLSRIPKFFSDQGGKDRGF